MAGTETPIEGAGRYIIKRPRLTRLLDNANARVLMLIGPAGFGKTTLAREWATNHRHAWYQGTPASADVAALLAGLIEQLREIVPSVGDRALARMRATKTPEHDVEDLADLLAEDLRGWPDDAWLVFDDYQMAMTARAPEHLVDLLLRKAPIQVFITSRVRPTWASARKLLYGAVYEVGRNELAMDQEEAAIMLAHRDESAAGIVALAEGWPAVIGLAALADSWDLPEGSLPEALYQYFAEELYQTAPAATRDDLCTLALAPSLKADTAEFLLGRRSTEAIAEGVRLGFISQRHGSTELHPLLRTFLETKSDGSRYRELRGALAVHLADRGLWDDAFSLLERYPSDTLLVTLLESGLSDLLEASRLPTLARWLELAHSLGVDAHVIDLAEAELAFYEGHRPKAEALAARAFRRFKASHPLASRAAYLAGTSAHMDYKNDEAGAYFHRALASAKSVPDRRNALWGQLMVLLDSEESDISEVMQGLYEVDDGTALSEVRLAVARFHVATRRGSLSDAATPAERAEHVVARVTDPHTRTSFYFMTALYQALAGDYEAALKGATRCEQYSSENRLSFPILHARKVRAMAEMGLRHFARSKQLLDRLERESVSAGEVFLEFEARILRSRLLVSQGLSHEAIRLGCTPPKHFPFEGEEREFLVTLGLAHACVGQTNQARDLVASAAGSRTVEVRTLIPCIEAICALHDKDSDAQTLARKAFEINRAVGNSDSFVVAYRGCPPLLEQLALVPEFQRDLSEIVRRAQDTTLARKVGLAVDRQPPGVGGLSQREREVLGLLIQGQTNRQIAAALFISEATVKVHVRHILEKLGARTRTEAAVLGTNLV